MDDLYKLNSAPDRKGGLSMEFTDAPQLFDMIDRYRRNLGWTWKRTFLVGFANTVAKQNDNPDLVIAIANYLEGRR